MEGVEDYAIDAINGLLDEKFNSSCKVSKVNMLALLDRILLFVGVYDNRAITLTFTEEGIDISSKQSNGIETIKYLESKNPKAFTCAIDIVMLMDQIKANESETIEIQYGNDKSIKLVNGDITQVIAFLDDEVANV
jgi:hypothetical protein